MTATDPRDVLSRSSLSALPIAVVGITVVLNALTGFDVLAISFAPPGIAAEWGVEPAALGVVLSMEFVGMALGSLLLGGWPAASAAARPSSSAGGEAPVPIATARPRPRR